MAERALLPADRRHLAQQWSEDIFSALFVNGKRFFRPKHLLLAVILPAGLLWGFCYWEYRTYVWPNEMARKEAKAKKEAAKRNAKSVWRNSNM